MVGIVIVTHGTLAKGLFESAQMLVGDQEDVRTLGLCLGDSIDEFREEVACAIGEMKEMTGDVLVLTDMLSGSPFNCVCAASEHCSFEHLTGINFPLLLEILSMRSDMTAHELMSMALECAPETVMDAGKFFEEVK